MTWVCDLCRRVAITDGELPSGWVSIGVKPGPLAYDRTRFTVDVCPQCKGDDVAPAATTEATK